MLMKKVVDLAITSINYFFNVFGHTQYECMYWCASDACKGLRWIGLDQ